MKRVIRGDVDLSNLHLTELPDLSDCVVSGWFSCNRNKLTSLVGSPVRVDETFSCFCNNLTSLEGAPEEVSGNFRCDRNKLTSLAGAPKMVGGSFHCENNSVQFTLRDVHAACKIWGYVYP